MHTKEIHNLKIKTIEHRKTILEMIHRAGSGHPGGSLGIIDVLTVLYGKTLRYNAKKPLWQDRDRVILSAGHFCPALYTVLADQGYYPKKQLLTLRKYGSALQGHPEMGKLPGIENTGGPLGQGIPFAVGKAIAAKKKGEKHRIFCISSDGEHQEGAVWEALQLAAQHQLNNLCIIIARDHLQIDGPTNEEVALRNLKAKYHSFGWKAIDIDGHNHRMIADALKYYSIHKLHQPFCIIAHTTLGKGVSYMEDNPAWHGKTPNTEELNKAIEELNNKQQKKILYYHIKQRKVFR